ncbi:hypothetical protein FZC83_16405 [Rossellomorea marisflavi]|uniref:TATA-box binding protein n=1 Tax=Rossellomorea marisflavi TaxID=189381 RepID=A0A5D4RM11_9BACI|nr:hypothetical protein FZC83_16405 [Rossellomorea marisflavi]
MIVRNFYIFVIFFIIIGFLYVSNGNNTIEAKRFTDIEKLDLAVERAGGKVNEWSLYARENASSFTQEGFAKHSELIQEKFSGFKWVTKKSTEETVVTGLRKTSHGTETIKILHTLTNGQSQSYTMYELRGSQTTWGESAKAYIKSEYIPNMDEIFTDKPLIFSCIKGKFSDTLEEVLSNQAVEMMDTLDANELESLKEEEFHSISAYSEQLSRTIQTKQHQDMNIQLGLRKSGMGAETTFVIGTPILIIEY